MTEGNGFDLISNPGARIDRKMQKKQSKWNGWLIFLSASVLMTLWAFSPVANGEAKTEFTILYTNDVMGEVEPCG